MAISDLLPSAGGDDLALTSDGVQEAVRRHVSITSPNTRDDRGLEHPISTEARGRAKRAIVDVLEHLMVRGEADRDALIAAYFEPNPPPARDQLRYAEHAGDAWWQDVVEPALRALPCVEPVDAAGEAWRFTGVAAGDYDDDHVVPLAELRRDPVVVAEAALDERGVARDSHQREAVLSCWRHLQTTDSATAEELDSELRRKSIDEVADDLAALPGVERDVETPPESEEITVETMADVIEGYERLDADPVETWRLETADGTAE